MDTIQKPYKLGLALSGGGAKGFAHLGVFQFLNECSLKPDIISGTSAGAVVGALYADGYSPQEIRNFSQEGSSRSLPNCKYPSPVCLT